MENLESILVQARDGRQQPGQWAYETVSGVEHFKMAALRVASFWGLAAFFVFVPVLHFVLVPAAFVAGIYFGIKSTRYTQRLLTLTTICPSCEKPLQEKALLFRDSLDFKCPSCSCNLTVLKMRR